VEPSSEVVGIVSALAVEARHFGPGKRLDSPWPAQPVTLSDGTLLVVSGMGASAAAAGAHVLIRAGARALVSFGLAGGLDPALPSGAILLPSEVISTGGASVLTAPHWRDGLAAELAARGPVSFGRLLTSTRAVGSVAEKAAVFRETGAAAVDMESSAVGEVAQTTGLPFIGVRVIVDNASDAVPGVLVAAANSGGELRTGQLIRSLVSRPGELGAFLRLAQRYRTAKRSLAVLSRAGLLAAHAFPTSIAGTAPQVELK
jgi:adenosylhomocysteine nucleosidase